MRLVRVVTLAGIALLVLPSALAACAVEAPHAGGPARADSPPPPASPPAGDAPKRIHVSPDALPPEVPQSMRGRTMAVRPHGSPLASSNHVAGTPPAGGHLSYQGNSGSVLSNVHVVDVYWGGNVDSTIRQRVPAQLDRFLSPMYMGWLDADYNTVFPGGTQQHINPGVWAGARTIQPSHTSNDLCQSDVEDELRYQWSIGGLGYVDGNSALMVHFPPGVTIHGHCFWWWSWDTTCQDNCGFHDATGIGANNVPFAVLPDISAPGCGCRSGTPDDAFSVESHELIEMVTDPYPHQQATWQDGNGDEIGDICNFLENDLPGGAVGSPVPVGQAQWSPSGSSSTPARARYLRV